MIRVKGACSMMIALVGHNACNRCGPTPGSPAHAAEVLAAFTKPGANHEAPRDDGQRSADQLPHHLARGDRRRGVGAHVVQELAGHAELSTTQRYAHALAKNKRAAIDVLEGIAATAVAA